MPGTEPTTEFGLADFRSGLCPLRHITSGAVMPKSATRKGGTKKLYHPGRGLSSRLDRYFFPRKSDCILLNFPKWELGVTMGDMRVVKEKTLREYWERHADIRGPLEAWYEHVRRVSWATPQNVQRDYGDDVILPGNRAVFNIKGKAYRLVVQIHYKSGIVFIRFIGTHAEYDRIDATTI